MKLGDHRRFHGDDVSLLICSAISDAQLATQLLQQLIPAPTSPIGSAA